MEDSNYRTTLLLMLKTMSQAYEEHQKTNHQLIITMGPTPEILIHYGFPALPLVITGKVVDKAFFDHGITKPILERAYKIIEDPKAIFKSKEVEESAVLLSFETNRGGDPLIVAVHKNKEIGRSVFYNNVASIYFKSGNAEARWESENLLQWRNMK